MPQTNTDPQTTDPQSVDPQAATQVDLQAIKEPRKQGIDLKLAIISAALLLIAAQMLYSSLGTYITGIMALSYKQTDAKVVKVEERYDPLGVSKIAELRYWINTEEKNASTLIPPGRVMKRGELTVLYYDPNNTKNVVLTQEIDYDPVIPAGAFGLLALCFGIFIGIKAKR